jgi:tripartite ATP-independent transporter DctM subunit
MAPEIIALLFFALAFVLLILGVHIGLCLALAGTLGIMVITGFDGLIGILKTTPYHAIAEYSLSVVPLFILMGMFSMKGGISEGTYNAANSWVGRFRGGLGIATTWACIAFGATSGSSVACASVFTKASYPEMRKAGYEKHFSCGLIATAATIDMLIPPSLYMVIYGMLAEASIAKLLIAGFLPGLLQALTLSLTIFFMAVRNPKLAPPTAVRFSWKERMVYSAKAWPILVLAVIIIGGIYSGVFSATEAAAVAAFASLVITIAQRKLSWADFLASLRETVYISVTITFVLIGAAMFSRLLTVSGLTLWLGQFVLNMGLSSAGVITMIMLIFIIMGCFIDALSIMFIAIPVFVPILVAMDINLIYFGVLATVALNMGTLTPPFGLCVFTVKAVVGDEVTTEGVFKAAMPFYVPVLATLVILAVFPQISLFLPDKMIGVR